MSSIVSVGSTVNNGNNKKKQPAESGELTRQIRIAAAFRPYVQGGFNNYYLPKYRSFADAQQRQEYSLGFRFGPIFDAEYQGTGSQQGGDNPIIGESRVVNFEGSTGEEVEVDIYRFGVIITPTVPPLPSPLSFFLLNIPTVDNPLSPEPVSLTKFLTIIISFSGDFNVIPGTFVGPADFIKEEKYTTEDGYFYKYDFSPDTLISTFESKSFLFQLSGSVPNVTTVLLDLAP